ncbi:MAG: hypothetical protein KAT68_02925 [Bacteroidales bacterium]|nr:hypothetical protein [Bacteroidales bacterium]
MMIRCFKFLLYVLVATGIMSACNDFFEENIEGQTVYLLAPADSLHTVQYENTFWWEHIEDADKYQLQIFSPSYDFMEVFVLDTNLSINKFTYTLYPGTFEWRVRAYNSSSSTDYFSRVLIIDSTETIYVSLRAPVDNFITNDSTTEFKWAESTNTDYFTFELYIDEELYVIYTTPDKSVTLPDESLDLPLLSDGNYTWRVKAQSSTSSGVSAIRSLIIDRTSPEAPTLIYPENNETVTELKVSWLRAEDTGSTIKDSVYIYKDTSLNINLYSSYYTSDTTYKIDEAPDADYFWKVISIDAAGNYSDNNGIRRFTLKNDTAK